MFYPDENVWQECRICKQPYDGWSGHECHPDDLEEEEEFLESLRDAAEEDDRLNLELGEITRWVACIQHAHNEGEYREIRELIEALHKVQNLMYRAHSASRKEVPIGTTSHPDDIPF